jgi:teichuronic acid biosynthesis glycosyltransferase TuaH
MGVPSLVRRNSSDALGAIPGIDREARRGQQPFLILAANTPWVYALGEALAEQDPVRCIRFYDWLNYRRLKPRWPTQPPPMLDRTMWVMPPGYAGSFEIAVRPFMRRLIDRWYKASISAAGRDPYVICPFPYLAPWLRNVPADRLIYYNLDEYTLYDPSRTERIRTQEDELITRAFCVLCLARYQVDALRARHPKLTEKIIHFPLGVQQSYILSDVAVAPVANTVGYVGNLGDRVDWTLVAEVVDRCPQATFIFVGAIDTGTQQLQWQRTRTCVLSRPNVRHVGEVAQADVGQYYWSFAVSWMPYDLRHPFNLASCPTKIMDGLASGRPLISTAIPEVELYPNLIHIARSTDEAINLITGFLMGGTTYDIKKQLDFAGNQSWLHRAAELRQLLDDRHPH